MSEYEQAAAAARQRLGEALAVLAQEAKVASRSCRGSRPLDTGGLMASVVGAFRAAQAAEEDVDRLQSDVETAPYQRERA